MNKLDKYIWDVAGCIRKIDNHLNLKGRRFDVFQKDILFNDAIRWNIALIGEAMNKILDLQPDIAISNARKLIWTCNYVIHGYDTFTDDMAWSIVIKELPILIHDLEALGFHPIIESSK